MSEKMNEEISDKFNLSLKDISIIANNSIGFVPKMFYKIFDKQKLDEIVEATENVIETALSGIHPSYKSYASFPLQKKIQYAKRCSEVGGLLPSSSKIESEVIKYQNRSNYND